MEYKGKVDIDYLMLNLGVVIGDYYTSQTLFIIFNKL